MRIWVVWYFASCIKWWSLKYFLLTTCGHNVRFPLINPKMFCQDALRRWRLNEENGRVTKSHSAVVYLSTTWCVTTCTGMWLAVFQHILEKPMLHLSSSVWTSCKKAGGVKVHGIFSKLLTVPGCYFCTFHYHLTKVRINSSLRHLRCLCHIYTHTHTTITTLHLHSYCLWVQPNYALFSLAELSPSHWNHFLFINI